MARSFEKGYMIFDLFAWSFGRGIVRDIGHLIPAWCSCYLLEKDDRQTNHSSLFINVYKLGILSLVVVKDDLCHV